LGLSARPRLARASEQSPQAKGLLEIKMPLRGSKLLFGAVIWTKIFLKLLLHDGIPANPDWIPDLTFDVFGRHTIASAVRR
jgi:hypothetical protein